MKPAKKPFKSIRQRLREKIEADPTTIRDRATMKARWGIEYRPKR